MRVLRFTLTLDMLLQAARAHNRSKWPRWLLGFTIFAGLVGLFVGLVTMGEVDLWFIAQIIGLALAWSFILFGWSQFWLIPRRLRKGMSYLDPESFDYEVEWDETHFSVRTGDGYSSTKFGRLAGSKQFGPLLLIYRLPDYYYVIPDSAFRDPAQRLELISRLNAAGTAATA